MTGDREPPGQAWIDQTSPEVLRPYMVTGDRTEPRYALQIDTVLTPAEETITGQTPLTALQPESRQVLQLCSDRGRPLFEVAALLGQPLLVTKIIVGDLIHCGALADPHPRTVTSPANEHLLRQTLAGLKALKAS